MEKKIDKRLKCSDDKKLAIKNALLATKLRRQNQVLRCYECKIVEKRLNNRQREELEQLFLEGKWFYNHVLNLHQNGQKLNSINTTNIKSVDHYDKDKNLIQSELKGAEWSAKTSHSHTNGTKRKGYLFIGQKRSSKTWWIAIQIGIVLYSTKAIWNDI